MNTPGISVILQAEYDEVKRELGMRNCQNKNLICDLESHGSHSAGWWCEMIGYQGTTLQSRISISCESLTIDVGDFVEAIEWNEMQFLKEIKKNRSVIKSVLQGRMKLIQYGNCLFHLFIEIEGGGEIHSRRLCLGGGWPWPRFVNEFNG